MRKKILAFVCIMAMTMQMLLPVSAADTTEHGEEPVLSESDQGESEIEIEDLETQTGYWINPLYEDLFTEEDFITEPSEYGTAACTEDIEYFTTDEEVITTLRENFRLRKTPFTIYYQSSQYLTAEDLARWNKGITAETTKADEGDYLLRHLGGWGYSYRGQIITSGSTQTYCYEIVYDVKYFTTYEQEEAVKTKVASLLSELGISSAGTDYEKAKRIYDYICQNVSYDYANLNIESYMLKYSAYAALMNQTAVCQGYANLFYYMAKTAGLSVRIVTGTANGGGHAWNIVKLDGKYYLLDSTWDAGNTPSYLYFLKGSNAYSYDHHLSEDYLTGEFTALYPISRLDYVVGGSSSCGQHQWEVAYTVTTPATITTEGTKVIYCAKCDEVKPGSQTVIPKIASVKLSSSLLTYNGKAQVPEIDAKDTKGTRLKSGTDYTVTANTNATDVGTYYMTVTFKGAYSGSKYLNYTIQPAAPATVSATLSGYHDVSITWKASPGATSYNVYYKSASNSSYTKLGSTTGTGIKKGNLADGTTYTFKVVPCYGNQTESTAYKTANVTTLKKMSVPRIRKISDKNIKIEWSAISGVSGYQVSKATSKTATTVLGNYGGTYVSVAPTSNTTYYYKVRAYKTVGKTNIYGPWSDVSAYNLKYIGSAEKVKADLSSYNAVQVTWSKTVGANQYALYYKKGNAKSYTYLGNTSGTSYIKSKLSAGAKYTFKVVPQYVSGGSVQMTGGEKTASVYTLKKLNTPKVSKRSSGKVKISWKNIEGESGYQISRATSKGKTSVCATISSTSASSKVLQTAKKKTYYYKVRAYKTVNGKKIYGPWSSVRSYKLK